MKIVQAKVLCGFLVLCGSLLLLSACGGGGGGDGSSATANTGTISVSLTDAQSGYDAVVLSIKEIGVVASNTATTYYNSSQLDNLPLTVNILDFPEEATLHLANIEVDLPENGEPVCFKQIRLVLAAEGDEDCSGPICNYVIETGDTTQYELKTPSGQQSGVKILTPNEFCIDADDDTAQVSIDFDPATAIVHNQNNVNNKDKYILKPTGIRIIEGSWSGAPRSFIDGLAAVPTYNSGSLCDAYATTPLVTVAAFVQGTSVDPVVQTVALTAGPVSGAEVCSDWCAEDQAPGACSTECEAGLFSECYYSGNFKLLLPDMGSYDLTASWQGFAASESAVGYNSSVLFELLED
jgi:hypothetical protein